MLEGEQPPWTAHRSAVDPLSSFAFTSPVRGDERFEDLRAGLHPTVHTHRREEHRVDVALAVRVRRHSDLEEEAHGVEVRVRDGVSDDPRRRRSRASRARASCRRPGSCANFFRLRLELERPAGRDRRRHVRVEVQSWPTIFDLNSASTRPEPYLRRSSVGRSRPIRPLAGRFASYGTARTVSLPTCQRMPRRGAGRPSRAGEPRDRAVALDLAVRGEDHEHFRLPRPFPPSRPRP